jgi:tetratricopeptide (TPR) repeat protein
MAEFWRGNLDDASTYFAQGAPFSPNPALTPTRSARFEALFLAYEGRKGEALALVQQFADDVRQRGARPVTARLALALLATEVYTIVGEKEEAAGFYATIVEWMRLGLVYRGPTLRLLETLAGMAAAGDERWDVAERHYQKALAIAASHPNLVELAEIKRFYGQMLLDRDAAGDDEKARELLREAIATYAQIGMPKHREMAEVLMKSAASVERSATATPGDSALFHKEGEFWAIAYQGQNIRLPDAKGLGYLAHLLTNSAKEIHVADLVAMVSAPVTRSSHEKSAGAGNHAEISTRHGDAGEVLDRQAARQYRTRLSELRAELEEASARGDSPSAEKLQSEIDFIAGELASAYGLGGRSRKIGDVDERLRKAVGNRITSAISRIRDAHPVLGEHLAKSIRLGVFCLYLPTEAIQWSS